MSDAKAPTKTEDIDVKSVMAGDEELPTFYRSGFTSFMKEAQKRDPDYRHRWIKKSPRNQHLKLLKGWTPVEDAQVLARLGLTSLVDNTGRATWDDLQLWRMPERIARKIQNKLSMDTAARSQSARAAVEATVADTTGRSHGKVVPFMGIDPRGTQDLVEKKQVSDVTATK